MSASNVRLGSEPVVHDAGSGGWTACGVMYGPPIHDEVIRFMRATPTGDPVDCMACLVRETLGPVDKLTIRATISVPVPMYALTFVIDPEPEPEPEK